MIVFLGNCQARFVSEAKPLRGRDHTCMTLFAPRLSEDPAMHRTRLHDDIRNYVSQDEIGHMERENLLQNQPSIRDLKELAPSALVFNLFHLHDYFWNEAGGYAFYLNVFDYVNQDSGLVAWLSQNATQKAPSHGTYYEDFLAVIRQIRRHFPATPVIILSRIPHYPAIRPRPFSYLRGWGEQGFRTGPFFQALSDVGNVHIIAMERVLAGLQTDHATLDSLLPHLILNKNLTHPNIALHIETDVEHPVAAVYSRVAELVTETLARGYVPYRREEQVPEAWHNGPGPFSPLPLDRLETMLRSGNDQSVTSSILHLFARLPKDHTDFIVANRPHIPHSPNVLTALKYYALATANKRFLEFFDAYRETALRRMHQNSTLYRTKFAGEIDKCVNHLKGLHNEDTGEANAREQHVLLNGRPLFRRYTSPSPLAADVQEELARYREICIWGAGGRGRLLLDLLANTPVRENVLAFLDSNEDLEGQYIEGIPIHTPDFLVKHPPEAIVVASTYEESITLQILSLGVASRVVGLSRFLDQDFTPFIRAYKAIDIRFE